MTTASRMQPYSASPPVPRRLAELSALQGRILEVLSCNGTSSTGAVRDALNPPEAEPRVVVERVYESLVALEHKGLVRRSTNAARTRPLWELRSPQSSLTTPRSHMMHSCSATMTALPDPTPSTIEDILGRIDDPAQAQSLAEVMLDKWDSGAWERWRPLAVAPLAGWLYAASRHPVSGRVDWILRGLANRPQWVQAAWHAEHEGQLHDSLLCVARLEDRQFGEVSWMLVLALLPWSACAGNHPAAPLREAR